MFTLLASCAAPTDSAKTDTASDTAGGDTASDTDTADTDTADTDTDTADTDTDTADTDTDTADDTGEPAARAGYTGPTRVVLVVAPASSAAPDAESAVVVVDPATGAATTIPDLTVRADTVADCTGRRLFALEGNKGTKADRAVLIDPDTLTVSAEWSLGTQISPVGVEIVQDLYWVAAAGQSKLYSFDAAGTAGDTVDLRAWADADGMPDTSGLYAVGDMLLASLANITLATGAYNTARVVAVDVTTLSVVGSTDLAGKAPTGTMTNDADALYVAHQASKEDGAAQPDGGVEKITLATMASAGLAIDLSTIPATPLASWLGKNGGDTWIVYRDADNRTYASAWSLSAGAMQKWGVAANVAAIGVIHDVVWLAENPFDGTAGSLVSRASADGVEASRITTSGKIKSVAVCVEPESGP